MKTHVRRRPAYVAAHADPNGAGLHEIELDAEETDVRAHGSPLQGARAYWLVASEFRVRL